MEHKRDLMQAPKSLHEKLHDREAERQRDRET